MNVIAIGVLVFADPLNNFPAMLSDRSYMRSDYPQRNTSAVVWMVAVVVAAYFLQLLLLSPWFARSGQSVAAELSLSIRNLESGKLWVLLTHAFLQNIHNPLEIILTLLALVYVGKEVEPLVGSRRTFVIAGCSILLGGLFWSATHWVSGGTYTGATAGVLGLLVTLACLYPSQQVSFLFCFLFPVTLRPIYVVLSLVVLNAVALLVEQLSTLVLPLNYAPSAHLGGMLAGWLYFRYFHANNGWDRASTLQVPALFSRKSAETDPDVAAPLPTRTPAVLRAQVDTILDKINSHGFASLTEEEKRTLDAAKDLLSRS